MFKVVSLFSGAGGFDLGFKGNFNYLNNHYPSNNFEIIFANDFDKYACTTYKANFGDNHLVEGDITEALKYLPKNCDVLIGGFPCQPFSSAGLQKGLQDERGQLYLKMLEAIKMTKPKVFIAENVINLVRMEGGEVIRKIIEDFSTLGYTLNYKVYNMKTYGVPQMRKRVIIVGTQGEPFEHLDLDLPIITCKEAIDDLKDIEDLVTSWNIPPNKRATDGRKLNPDNVGCTLTTTQQPIHYEKPRRLSIQEMVRLQTFPDDFDFSNVSKSFQFKQIGNAVPPVFAWHLARKIEDHLNKFTQ